MNTALSKHVRFEDLQPGDKLRITRRIKVGLKIWNNTVLGTVIRTERRRNGLHVDRNNDDFAFQDVILLQKAGDVPEETTIALDEFTIVEKVD